MFEYLKEEVEDELERCMLDYDKKQDEKEDVLYQINLFSDLKEIKNELLSNKISFTCWISLLVMMFILTAISNIHIIIGALFVLLPTFKVAQYSTVISNNKLNCKEIENKCLEIARDVLKDESISLELNKKVLKQVTDVLSDKKCDIESNITSIERYIKEVNGLLNFCEDYDRFFSSENMICYKYAKDSDKFNIFVEYKCICDNNSLDKYLQEPIDYSNIHFNHKITDSIDYTESSKKLIKKI